MLTGVLESGEGGLKGILSLTCYVIGTIITVYVQYSNLHLMSSFLSKLNCFFFRLIIFFFTVTDSCLLRHTFLTFACRTLLHEHVQ